MMQHPTDELQSLALGELDRASGRAVMEHADACAECATQLADAMRGVAALAAAGDLAEPRRARAPHGPRWIIGGLAAAAIVLGIWNVDLQMTASSVPVDALVHSHFAHHALAGAGGQAKLVQALDGSWVYVIAVGLEPLRGYDVEINSTAVGSLHADLSGKATGFWRRTPGKITSAALSGPGSTLRWDGR